MRIPALALVLLLAAACSSDPTPRSQPSPTSPPAGSPTPPTAMTPVARPPLRVAVRAHDGVVLMTVDQAHRAHLVRRLQAPTGFHQAEELAVASGPSARVCVSWSPGDNDSRRVLGCYDAGETAPRVVATPKGPGTLALRADGGAIAWTERIEHPTYPTDNLVVAQLSGGRATHLQRVTSSTSQCPGECFQGCSPDALSWAGTEAILLTAGCESDDGNPLRRLRLADLSRGWLDASDQVSPPEDERPYVKYDGGGTATATEAYAVERMGGFEDEGPPERAVRIDLRTRKVLDVVATAQPDRYVPSVSGGPVGVVYVTVSGFEESGWTDPRFYARLPGEAHGTRITGLPSYLQEVVAYG